ncbi:MAG: hypothetical protein ACK5I7_07765 [Anaerotignum sp.]
METKKGTYSRVLTKDIHPTPAHGIYVTKEEKNQIYAYGILFFIIFTVLSLFSRKK